MRLTVMASVSIRTVPSENIDELRCDGLVEVCYELVNVEVWGANSTHYLLNFAAEHNDLGMNEPQTELSPVFNEVA